MSLPWFRLYAELATDPKIQLLAFEDQRHYVMLLCLKCNGTLDSAAASPDLRERMIARSLGLALPEALSARKRLVEVGLISKAWQPLAWDKRQAISDSSAERTRRWREKRNGDGDVTSQRRSRVDKSRREYKEPPKMADLKTPQQIAEDKALAARAAESMRRYRAGEPT